MSSYDVYQRRLHERSDVSITIECGCGDRLPLSALYYCRDCKRLTCQDCASASIDSHFCPQCLNSVFSSHAFASRGRCESCALCPICRRTLTAAKRAATATFHLKCDNCQWTSDAAGLETTDYAQLIPNIRDRETANNVSELQRRTLALKQQRANAAANAQSTDFGAPTSAVTSAQSIADARQWLLGQKAMPRAMESTPTPIALFAAAVDAHHNKARNAVAEYRNNEQQQQQQHIQYTSDLTDSK